MAKIPKINIDEFLAQAAQNVAAKGSISPSMEFLQASLAAPPGGSALSGQGPATGNVAAAGRTGGTAGESLGGAAFTKFVNAIAKQESGGNYSAVNKSSGALGKYQIMPANIPSWSKAALGHSISTQKFLNTPRLQDIVAQTKMREYFKRYGATGAAQAWYGGEGSVGKTNRSGGAGYPTVGGYSAAIRRRMGG